MHGMNVQSFLNFSKKEERKDGYFVLDSLILVVGAVSVSIILD